MDAFVMSPQQSCRLRTTQRIDGIYTKVKAGCRRGSVSFHSPTPPGVIHIDAPCHLALPEREGKWPNFETLMETSGTFLTVDHAMSAHGWGFYFLPGVTSDDVSRAILRESNYPDGTVVYGMRCCPDQDSIPLKNVERPPKPC